MDNNPNQKVRQFGLTNIAVDNSTSIFLLAGIILILGIFGYQRMAKEQFPEVELPQI